MDFVGITLGAFFCTVFAFAILIDDTDTIKLWSFVFLLDNDSLRSGAPDLDGGVR